MKTNLKFQLVKFEGALAFQIHEQTEEWREKRNKKIYPHEVLEFYAKKNIHIYSLRIPDLRISPYNFDIGLQGINRKKNNRVCLYNNCGSDYYYKKILEALKQWSAHVYKETNREEQPFQDLGNGVFVV
ncbi:MAG: hypothetical protein BV457_00065 [Thermoplasmata archaeon M9B1D]|nr:MAG: hypothetical protein BV457_00065 [Thermoplasmata archaeon M9B1D]PNX52241.1 MAG: hypothetical protein BV456_00230 [Thermoplasmata archaeon M8B2D]